jgi:hypothetical protein
MARLHVTDLRNTTTRSTISSTPQGRGLGVSVRGPIGTARALANAAGRTDLAMRSFGVGIGLAAGNAPSRSAPSQTTSVSCPPSGSSPQSSPAQPSCSSSAGAAATHSPNQATRAHQHRKSTPNESYDHGAPSRRSMPGPGRPHALRQHLVRSTARRRRRHQDAGPRLLATRSRPSSRPGRCRVGPWRRAGIPGLHVQGCCEWPVRVVDQVKVVVR